MKKIIFTTACAAMMTLSASSVFAAEGEVKFTGEILETACEVTSDNPLTVDLGKVVKSQFVAAGDKAAKTKFTLTLENCPVALKNVQVKFDGEATGSDNSKIATTGGATGVGIQLYNADNSELSLRESSQKYALQAETPVDLDFYASYISTEDTVGAGIADGSATFTLTYTN